MGQVYLAAHPRLPREDALKVLPAELTTDPKYRARFVREADLAAGLSLPHVVRVHDRGEYDGQLHRDVKPANILLTEPDGLVDRTRRASAPGFSGRFRRRAAHR